MPVNSAKLQVAMNAEKITGKPARIAEGLAVRSISTVCTVMNADPAQEEK